MSYGEIEKCPRCKHEMLSISFGWECPRCDFVLIEEEEND